MPGLSTLFLEQAGVLDGDTGFAGQHAHEFQMTVVKGPLVIAEDCQRANDAVVSDQGHAAEAAPLANGFDTHLADFGHVIVANEHRLARADDVFSNKVSSRSAPRRLAFSANHFQFKNNFV